MRKIEDALKTVEFSCTKGTDGGVANFFFMRKKAHLDEIIRVYGRKQSKGITDYNLKLQIPEPCIAFPLVENFISEITGSDAANFYTIGERVSNQVLASGINGLVVDNFEIEVNTENEKERYADFLLEVYNKYAINFYERFSDLQKVDDYLMENPRDEKRIISNGIGNTALHRIIIIKYLCKNPAAEEYHRSVKNEFQKKMDNKTIASMNELLLKIEKKLGVTI